MMVKAGLSLVVRWDLSVVLVISYLDILVGTSQASGSSSLISNSSSSSLSCVIFAHLPFCPFYFPFIFTLLLHIARTHTHTFFPLPFAFLHTLFVHIHFYLFFCPTHTHPFSLHTRTLAFNEHIRCTVLSSVLRCYTCCCFAPYWFCPTQPSTVACVPAAAVAAASGITTLPPAVITAAQTLQRVRVPGSPSTTVSPPRSSSSSACVPLCGSSPLLARFVAPVIAQRAATTFTTDRRSRTARLWHLRQHLLPPPLTLFPFLRADACTARLQRALVSWFALPLWFTICRYAPFTVGAPYLLRSRTVPSTAPPPAGVPRCVLPSAAAYRFYLSCQRFGV